MSYGLIAINEDSYVQIDSDSPRLCLMYKGSYGGSSYVVNITFPAPITTVEPPMIFIRPNAGSRNEMLGQLSINGSSGNWTGFSLHSRNVTFQPTGLWFAAVFATKANSGFGMRLWDDGGTLIYDTGNLPVQVITARADWVYAGTETMTIGVTALWYISRGLAAGEYMMINNFAQASMAASASGAWTGIGVAYSENRTYMFQVSVAPWIDEGYKPVLYARLSS
jgi:hypothetical protein